MQFSECQSLLSFETALCGRYIAILLLLPPPSSQMCNVDKMTFRQVKNYRRLCHVPRGNNFVAANHDATTMARSSHVAGRCVRWQFSSRLSGNCRQSNLRYLSGSPKRIVFFALRCAIVEFGHRLDLVLYDNVIFKLQ